MNDLLTADVGHSSGEEENHPLGERQVSEVYCPCLT